MQLPPQHFHLSKRYVKFNMVLTKFLIFPESSPTRSLSHISFDGNCIFLDAQAKNLERLGPGVSLSLILQTQLPAKPAGPTLRMDAVYSHFSPLSLLPL